MSMSTDQIIRKTSDERVAGKSKEENAQGLVTRSVREDTPLIDMQLRESGEERTELIDLARVEFARLAGITLTQPAPESDSEVPVEGVADAILEQEGLDERLEQQFKEMKEDFDGNGIVLIDENFTPGQYQAALKADKTAGKDWERDLKSRLLDNDAALLKKAAEMPEGGQLIGVYPNGDLAIRQRSQEIMNARWTKDWEDGQSDKGELRLLPHIEALAQKKGKWAKTVEILRAVKAEGYHVPADAPDYEKKGLVAASEVVTSGHYVMSPGGKEWRDAILECEDDVVDNSHVRVVDFSPGTRYTCVDGDDAFLRSVYRGAVLWLRG